MAILNGNDILFETRLYASVPIDEIATWETLAETNRKIKVVAGVIRNEGNGWEFIENSTHSKLGFTSITQNASYITVNYNFTAKKILGFSVTPDETFMQQGVACGASVGVSSANIYLNQSAKAIGGYIYYNGTDWAKSGVGITNLSFASQKLTVTHDDLGAAPQTMASVVGRDGVICSLGSCGGTITEITFWNADGTKKTTPDTSMKCYLTRNNRTANISPANLVSAAGNLWIVGVFEIE